MGSKTLLVAGAVVGAGALIYVHNKKTTAKALRFLLKRLDLSKGKVYLTFQVQNPSTNSLTFQSLAGDLDINGSPVGNVSFFQAYKIPANGVNDLKIAVAPSLIGAVQLLISLFTTTGQGVTIAFAGNAVVDNINLPINISVLHYVK